MNLFYENSTRTRISFELAEKRLSADTINFSASGSSVSKGETLLDTVNNILSMKVDMVVMRHSASGAPHFLAKHSLWNVPVLGTVIKGARQIPVYRGTADAVYQNLDIIQTRSTPHDYVVVLAGDKTAGGDQVGWAVAAGATASFLYGIGINLVRRHLTGLPPAAVASATLGASALLTLPFAIANWPTNPIPMKSWFSASMLGVVCTGLAFVMYYRLIAASARAARRP